MTNISKQRLDEKVEQKLFKQFTDLFIAAEERKLAEMFNALFTDAEKLMFVKRIAIVLMLSKNVPMYGIAKSLHVSLTTVRAQRDLYETGQYEPITRITRKKNFDTESFLSAIEMVLRLGMPSYGKNRWRVLR